MSLIYRLSKEWEALVKEHGEEMLNTYNETVEKGGNKETYEEFVAKLRIEWFKEMMSK